MREEHKREILMMPLDVQVRTFKYYLEKDEKLAERMYYIIIHGMTKEDYQKMDNKNQALANIIEHREWGGFNRKVARELLIEPTFSTK